jgi:hypothetical protein
MQITCPHCSHTDSDGLGLLNEQELHTLKCGGCGNLFYCLIHDCDSCLHESVFSWPSAPSYAALTQWHCECCSKPVGAQLQTPDADFDKNILIRPCTPGRVGNELSFGAIQ